MLNLQPVIHSENNASDGSEITLNKHSSIQYASASYSNKRIIKLQGEAFLM